MADLLLEKDYEVYGLVRRRSTPSTDRLTHCLDRLRIIPGDLTDSGSLERALTPKTLLISLLHANNEIGIIQPIREVGAIARRHGVLLHVDAAQSFGKIPIDVQADNIDLLSMSGHKIYGPKGVGALYVRRLDPRVEIAAQIDGGGHERGMRSGTLNVPGIVGLGKAGEIAAAERDSEARRLGPLRDRLRQGLLTELDGVTVNGSLDHLEHSG